MEPCILVRNRSDPLKEADSRHTEMVSGSPIVAFFERAAERRQAQLISSKSTAPPGTQQMASSHALISNTESSSERTDEQNPTSADTKKHNVRHVLKVSSRAVVFKWMISKVSINGERHIASNDFHNFPKFFRSSANAIITRATRLWKSHHQYKNDEGEISLRGTGSTVTCVCHPGLKQMQLKARKSRGRKHTAWFIALHEYLRSEFDHLRKLCVKFNLTTLRHLSLELLRVSENHAYSPNMTYPCSEQPRHVNIDASWVQIFAE